MNPEAPREALWTLVQTALDEGRAPFDDARVQAALLAQPEELQAVMRLTERLDDLRAGTRPAHGAALPSTAAARGPSVAAAAAAAALFAAAAGLFALFGESQTNRAGGPPADGSPSAAAAPLPAAAVRSRVVDYELSIVRTRGDQRSEILVENGRISRRRTAHPVAEREPAHPWLLDLSVQFDTRTAQLERNLP